jgi:hypothetical protein
LLWWLAGPSARMICPTFRARSRPITGGPTRNASTSAVTVAPAALKLM